MFSPPANRTKLQSRHAVGRDGAVEELMCQRRDVGVVSEAVFAQKHVSDSRRGSRSKHRADVDGHVEQAEAAVAFRGVFRVIVEVSDHHLQVAFEEARAYGDAQQGDDHHGERHAACGVFLRKQQQIARKHHQDAGDDGLSEAPELIGDVAAYDRHEIDRGEEDAVKLSGRLC